MAARGSLTIIFPEQVQSVDTSSISSSGSITTSGESVTTTTDDGQTYSVAFTLVAGYKINGADFTPSVNGGIVDSFTDSTVDITAGAAGIDGTLTITVQQSESTTVKTVSSDNLARFKQKCDETYAKIGEGGGSDIEIPTPTTSDNGKVLGVSNGAYALQEASGGGTQLYGHSFSIECTDGPISWTGYLTLICSKPERFNTPAEIAQYFLNKGAVAGDWIPCNGYANESSNYSQIIAIKIVSTNSVSVFGANIGIEITSITATKSYDVIPL